MQLAAGLGGDRGLVGSAAQLSGRIKLIHSKPINKPTCALTREHVKRVSRVDLGDCLLRHRCMIGAFSIVQSQPFILTPNGSFPCCICVSLGIPDSTLGFLPPFSTARTVDISGARKRLRRTSAFWRESKARWSWTCGLGWAKWWPAPAPRTWTKLWTPGATQSSLARRTWEVRIGFEHIWHEQVLANVRNGQG